MTLLETVKEIERIQANMAFTSGENTQEYIREAREEQMSGYGMVCSGSGGSGDGMTFQGDTRPKWLGSHVITITGRYEDDPPDKTLIEITNGFGTTLITIAADGRVSVSPEVKADDLAQAFLEALNILAVNQIGPVLFPLGRKKPKS